MITFDAISNVNTSDVYSQELASVKPLLPRVVNNVVQLDLGASRVMRPWARDDGHFRSKYFLRVFHIGRWEITVEKTQATLKCYLKLILIFLNLKGNVHYLHASNRCELADTELLPLTLELQRRWQSYSIREYVAAFAKEIKLQEALAYGITSLKLLPSYHLSGFIKIYEKSLSFMFVFFISVCFSNTTNIQ